MGIQTSFADKNPTTFLKACRHFQQGEGASLTLFACLLETGDCDVWIVSKYEGKQNIPPDTRLTKQLILRPSDTNVNRETEKKIVHNINF